MTTDLARHPILDGKTFLVCVGAAKCATSWLHGYLDALPGAVVSPLKELHFFNAKFPTAALGDPDAIALTRLSLHLEQPGTPLDNLRARPAFQASLDRVRMIYDDNAYFAHFARLCSADTRCFADLTPAYSTIGAKGFAYLRDFCASQGARLRILFLMRDPVARYWSQIRHLEQINPSDKATQQWQHALTAPPLTARADYRATVTALDATFPPEDLLYLFYETLFDEQSLRRFCAFCDLPFISGNPAEPRNETRVKTPMSDDVHAALLSHLAPQYAFCRARFGADVPAAWSA